MHAIRVRTACTLALWRVAAAVPLALGFAGALVLVVTDVAAGRASVGDLTLAIVLAQTMAGNLSQLIGMAEWLLASLAVGARLLWLDDVARAEPRGELPAPDRLATGIELDNVSFRYPGTSRRVLDAVSFTMPAGAVVAVVGDNGAGKSTLAKLLAGMYDVDAGAIRVDGTDVADLDVEDWRWRCTGAFQDHARFELTLHGAVALGAVAPGGAAPAAVPRRAVPPRRDLPESGATDAVGSSEVAAALAAAGAADLPDQLAGGLQTQLGGTWPGGTDLSGGQWQKVALARAFVRTEPLLTILDEPTAALDAETEDALFATYAATARESRARGAVTLLISHRFSTVRMADEIVVLEAGRVIEQGSHAELIRARGRYAELYDLQARGYR